MSETRTPDPGLPEKLESLRTLEATIERLRAPDGCPWDRAQTLDSMAPNIIEEACEAADAIREARGAAVPAVLEELGDLLMNVLLAARIAEESGAFGIREVATAINAKLIRRHPHVFGDEKASDVDAVLRRWTAIKAEEKKSAGGESEGRSSRLGRIPRSLPALTAGLKMGERAGSVGFDWPDAAGAFAKIEEEVGEVRKALGTRPADPAAPPPEELHREIGDLLFAVVNFSRKTGIDPEGALRSALGRFERRFRYIEERIDVSRANLDEMEALWQEAKTREER